MLENVLPVEELRGVARTKARGYTTKTIHPSDIEEYVSQGWTIDKRTKKSVRVRKPKHFGTMLEDRAWTLLERMRFKYLSGQGGARLVPDGKATAGPTSQLDVVAIDDEVALSVECKSAERLSKRPQFQEELGKFSLTRERFVNAVPRQFISDTRRQVALVMFTSNSLLTDNDKLRAKEAGVTVFDEHDLAYYEELVAHLGPAAKYQFLADVLPGKQISGLQLRVPAIKSKMGGHTCYTFSISPEYLLKVAYVSHRAKGKASDVDTYQRMIRKPRLIKLRKFIEDEDGIFPTNIVVNFDKRLQFERSGQAGNDQDSGVMGWLDIRPAYKSAWIIDGQHRLFAYSGLERALKARLSILAFENLPPSKQAELFIDINAQQKSVKQSLLQEMYAELNWNSDVPEDRISAVISKAVQSLNADAESPFYGRILGADDKKDAQCCISLSSVFRALEHPDLFLSPAKRAGIMEYGPLWASATEAMRKRTVHVLNSWFELIYHEVPDWWDVGAGEGGGLSMNDGVSACIQVLRSVFQHLSANGANLATMEDDDLSERTKPYGAAVGKYLASLSGDDRRRFRELRGAQGVTTRTRRCQQAIRQQVASFNPPGLEDFLATEKAQTNTRAKAMVDEIEVMLQRTIVEELKGEFALDEMQWWTEGVPKGIRMKVIQRHEDDDGKRGGREYYFDLLDYRHIILNNWEIFGPIFGYAQAGAGKEKRTNWIQEINEIRRIVAHVSAGRSVSLEQLAQLENYHSWLESQMAGGATEQQGA